MPEKPYDHNEIELKWHERWKDADLLQGGGELLQAQVLRARDAALPQRHAAHGPRPQLLDRRRAGALHVDAAASTCCIPWAGTPSGCRPRTPPSSQQARIRASGRCRNIADMKRQHRRMAFSYDWDREVSTCEPEYYRWNQWFFLQDAGARPGLSQEGAGQLVPEVRHRAGQRAGGGRLLLAARDTPVEQRELEQWFLQDHRLRRRAARRHRASWKAAGRSACCTMQRNWIGRSRRRGGRFHARRRRGEPIRVFTTRVDTIYGATCVILAPEHPLVDAARSTTPASAARQGDDRRARAPATRATSRRKASSPATTPSIRTAARRSRSGSATSC